MRRRVGHGGNDDTLTEINFYDIPPRRPGRRSTRNPPPSESSPPCPCLHGHGLARFQQKPMYHMFALLPGDGGGMGTGGGGTGSDDGVVHFTKTPTLPATWRSSNTSTKSVNMPGSSIHVGIEIFTIFTTLLEALSTGGEEQDVALWPVRLPTPAPPSVCCPERRSSSPTPSARWGTCGGIRASGSVAIVEHGVPLMRSKWVHRLWAHQEGEQGQGSRLADGTPHLPHGDKTGIAPTTTAKDQGTSQGPLQPGR